MAARDNPGYESLSQFFSLGQRRAYKKGEIILHAGDDPRGVYFIESGFVKIYALTRQGDEHIHLFYGQGDIFPMIWVYRDAVKNVYYQAMAPTTVYMRGRDDFRAFVSSDRQRAELMLEKMAGLYRVYAGMIDNLLYSNSYERTAGRLLALAYRFGKPHRFGLMIDAPLTHHDIASSINLSRETTSRAMERLQRHRLIGYDAKRRIVITGLAGLVKIIGEDEVRGLWPSLMDAATPVAS